MYKTFFLLIIIMALWGFNVSALTILVTTIDPLTLTAVRIFVAGITVFIIMGFLGILRLPTKEEWRIIGIITTFNIIVHHCLLAIGLTRTTGVNAGIIVGVSPLATIVLSVIFLNNRVSKASVLGFVLGFIGIIVTSLVGSQDTFSISIGDVYIFLCVVSQAVSFILISKLNPSFDTRLLTGYMMVGGSIVIYIFGLFLEGNPLQIGILWDVKFGSIFLFSSVLATALGHTIYNQSVRKVGPEKAAIFFNFNTLFAVIGAALFLQEPIMRNHYIGIFLIIIGVTLGSGILEKIFKRNPY